jgi:hyperosmotically inducible protein
MKIHHSITLRNALVLTALAAALGAGQAYAAGTDASSTTSGSSVVKKTERVMSDSWITTKVKSELLADSGTKAFKVRVKTMHGVVALHGALPSQESIDQVKQIAEKVKGVKSVDASAMTVASK